MGPSRYMLLVKLREKSDELYWISYGDVQIEITKGGSFHIADDSGRYESTPCSTDTQTGQGKGN